METSVLADTLGVLDEAYNLDRGLIGIDLEFLVLNHASYSFVKFVSPMGFTVKGDVSVHGSDSTLEAIYEPVEIASALPWYASELLPKLEKVLAWLKHVDTLKTIEYIWKKSEQHIERNRPVKLPRGRVPKNLSAGLHLHFDVDGWFSDTDHIARFVKLVSDTQDDIKAHVVPGRYTRNRSSRKYYGQKPPGQEYAEFPGDGDVDQLADISKSEEYNDLVQTSDVPIRPRRAIQAYNGMTRNKFSAVNMNRVDNYGDVEIRFMHATINFQTIVMWLKMIIGMIEHTRTSRDSTWKDLKRSVAKEEPELDKHLDATRSRMAKVDMTKWDPFNRRPSEPTRAVRRILGTTLYNPAAAKWSPPTPNLDIEV